MLGIPSPIRLDGKVLQSDHCAMIQHGDANVDTDLSEIDGGTVLVHRQETERGLIAHLLIDHQQRRNAIGPAVIAALTEHAHALADDTELRAVTLSGAGGCFAAGANVKVMAGLDTNGARAFITSLHKAIQSVRAIPVPVLAVLHGHCYGAAMELAAACDIRIADPSLIAGMPEVQVGLPSVIEACLLPRLIGWGAAADLVLTGREIDADAAQRLGFVQHLAQMGGLADLQAKVLAQILSAGPKAVRAQKCVMRGWDRDESAAIAMSIDAFAGCFETGEPQAMLAKIAKR